MIHFFLCILGAGTVNLTAVHPWSRKDLEHLRREREESAEGKTPLIWTRGNRRLPQTFTEYIPWVTNGSSYSCSQFANLGTEYTSGYWDL